ncbi:MAG: (d)CMP kinase [Clostridia bacterium]|nr:(d)CMP kinase [Clostridia bacterium]MBQ4397421.1 (d)CMP kinase [Clostridia bacterium]
MIQVAIDGPSGAGKSSISREAARRLGFIYVDTGAMYRAAAVFIMQRRIDPDDAEKIGAVLPMMDIELRYEDGEQKVYLCGENVSRVIRTREVTRCAPIVSAQPKLRQCLSQMQQEMAQHHNIIMDGRDIGTVVLPNADVKIFLTASPEVRAQRRYKELLEKGMEADYDSVLADIRERDYYDENKPISPLRPAADSVLIDTSELDFEHSVQLVVDTIQNGIKY